MFNSFRYILLITLCHISCTKLRAQSDEIFPLHISENGRFLIDNTSEPFLLKEFSAWGMIQSLSEEDASAMMDSLKLKGFNTLLVSIVSNAPDQMGGNPPNWQGVSPFNVTWDFSTPNETYFQHVDRFIKTAESKGFMIYMVPCYLGYYTAGGQGWWDEIHDTNNSPVKMKKYGEFLGRRYKDSPNLIWVIGGDNDANGKEEAYMKNLVTGIKTFDKNHLWTGHFSSYHWSMDNDLYKNDIDIDGHYVWKEVDLPNPQYVYELEHYKKNKMIIQLDQSYEHDVPHYADNENPQWIRRKMWDGLLSGCAGTSFSSGTLDNQAYWMKDWKPLMNTTGMRFVSNCFDFFETIPWYYLVPDTTDKVVIEGRGTFGSKEYICVAGSFKKDIYVMYIPKGNTFYVNIKEMIGKRMRVHWYNPRTGRSIKIGHVGGEDERFGVVCPDDKDWVIVFDNLPNLVLP